MERALERTQETERACMVSRTEAGNSGSHGRSRASGSHDGSGDFRGPWRVRGFREQWRVAPPKMFLGKSTTSGGGVLEAQTSGGVLEVLSLGGAREALNWKEPAETKVSWTGPVETKVSWAGPAERKESWTEPTLGGARESRTEPAGTL